MRFYILFFLLLNYLYADNSYELGKKLYVKKGCYTCHGHKAEGMHAYPYLANRSKGYLTHKLERFRSKKADNQQEEMMISFSLDLSDDDINNLTTFFTDFVDDDSGEKYDDSYQVSGDGGS